MGIREHDVLDFRIAAKVAEQTFDTDVCFITTFIPDTADGVVLSVEVAVEFVGTTVADGCVVGVVTSVGIGVSDVAHQFEILVAVVVAAIDAGGEHIELVLVQDLVGMFPVGTSAFPFGSGDVGSDNDIGVRHVQRIAVKFIEGDFRFVGIVLTGIVTRFSIVKKETHSFARSGIKHTVILDASAVTDDTDGGSGRSYALNS